ncbi:lipopolysaccharide biosynthesis protein [Rubrivirga sp.]|uniref:lipopolysaccharide biosynthesis protein n=1 Tax=Rubrivirga sp. TaxID=1885344 RepID=UPI003C795724
MLRRLVRQSGVYSIVNVVGKLSGVFLLALFGNPEILSTADFGYLGGLNAVMMFSILLAGVGLPLGIIRFSSAPTLDEDERRAVPATALSVATVAGVLFTIVGWFGAAWGSEALFGDASRADVIRWLVLFVGFKTVSDVSYTVLRQREQAGSYALIGALEAGLLAVLVAVFLLRGEGLAGVMKGYAISAGVITAIVTPALLKRIDRRVRWDLIGPMLAFGAPLILSGVAGRFLNLGDRFLIIHFLGPEANAPYEWAARFGGVVNTLLVQSFMLAFTVLGMKSLDETGTPDLHRQSFRHFSALAGWVVLGLALFVGDVSRLLTDVPAYIETDGLVLLVAGGFAFYGLYYVVVNVLYVAGRTQAVALSVGAAAVLNLVLNLALIPVMGIAGAAVATLLSYAALAAGTAHLAQSSTPVDYPWGSLLAVSALVTGLWVLGQPTEEWSVAARLASRVGIALAYLPGLWLLGVYRRDDLDRALEVVRARGRDAEA